MGEPQRCLRCGMAVGLCVCHIPVLVEGLDVALNVAIAEFAGKVASVGVKVERGTLHPFDRVVLILRGVRYDEGRGVWVLGEAVPG